MQRRNLLKLGLGATVILVVAGGGVALLNPALSCGHLGEGGRDVMRAVARAVLDGALPTAADEREKAIEAHLQRVDAAIAEVGLAALAHRDIKLDVLVEHVGLVAPQIDVDAEKITTPAMASLTPRTWFLLPYAY